MMGTVNLPATLATLITLPFDCRNNGRHQLVTRTTPKTLTSNVFWYTSISLPQSNGQPMAMPALFTTAHNGNFDCRICATAASTSFGLVTSNGMTRNRFDPFDFNRLLPSPSGKSTPANTWKPTII